VSRTSLPQSIAESSLQTPPVPLSKRLRSTLDEARVSRSHITLTGGVWGRLRELECDWGRSAIRTWQPARFLQDLGNKGATVKEWGRSILEKSCKTFGRGAEPEMRNRMRKFGDLYRHRRPTRA